MPNENFSILVTGGAGYIGSVLCPKLFEIGHKVTILDTLFFGIHFSDKLLEQENFTVVQGDIRDKELLNNLLNSNNFDRVIHLAAISNDPCSDLDAQLTTSINSTATEHLIRASKKSGVKRFLYASSASVYGIKDLEDVNESLSLEPITLYARFKAQGEQILNDMLNENFEGVSIRAATVCGYSPRLRLDLTVNIFTYQAVCEDRVKIFGGKQMRPNIHIQDLTDFYVLLLDAENVSGKAFNVSHSNAAVIDLAKLTIATVNNNVPLEVLASQDNRSYHLSSKKAERELGFNPKLSIENAIQSVAVALNDENVISTPSGKLYRNIEYMCKELDTWKQ